MLAESGRVAKYPLSRSIALVVHPVHLEVRGQTRPLAKQLKLWMCWLDAKQPDKFRT